MILNYLCIAFAISIANNQLTPAQTVVEPTIRAAAEAIVDGESPGIVAENLPAGQIVRIHVLRCFEKWQDSNGQWARVPIKLHAWASFKVDESGQVRLDTAIPQAGVYSKPDPLALLRNGLPEGDPRLEEAQCADLTGPAQPSNEVFLNLELNHKLVAKSSFRLIDSSQKLEFVTIAEPDLHGVFCRPSELENYPVVISLHGSEGGSIEKARQRAATFASRGYACLAVNYFARQYEGIEGLRTEHVDVPLETIAAAKAWLDNQTGVNTKRIFLYGSSKGAEFALLAGTKFDWITGIIAIVPSDVVWEGYRDSGGTGARTSSWSFSGQPLSFIPLFDYEPANEGVYRTNTERYSRSRQFYADLVAAARIEVETIDAKVLLIASDRDEVWESGDMTRNIVERFAACGKSERVCAVIYPQAGHMITGIGTFPIYLYGVQSPDPLAKDLAAEGEAMADAWRRTLSFLENTLEE